MVAQPGRGGSGPTDYRVMIDACTPCFPDSCRCGNVHVCWVQSSHSEALPYAQVFPRKGGEQQGGLPRTWQRTRAQVRRAVRQGDWRSKGPMVHGARGCWRSHWERHSSLWRAPPEAFVLTDMVYLACCHPCDQEQPLKPSLTSGFSLGMVLS
jgi:hypothetical protein